METDEAGIAEGLDRTVWPPEAGVSDWEGEIIYISSNKIINNQNCRLA